MAAANEATPLRDLDNGGGNGSGEDGDGYNRNPVGATEADLKGGSSRRQVVASSDGVPVNLRAALFFSLEGDYGRIGRIVESGVCVLILAAVIILCLQSGNGLRHKYGPRRGGLGGSGWCSRQQIGGAGCRWSWTLLCGLPAYPPPCRFARFCCRRQSRSPPPFFLPGSTTFPTLESRFWVLFSASNT